MYEYMELSEGSRNKFWEVFVSGNTLRTYWGKPRTNGKSTTKVFVSHEKALAEAKRRIREKSAKGYRVTVKPISAGYGLMADCTMGGELLARRRYKGCDETDELFLRRVARELVGKASLEVNKEYCATNWEQYGQALVDEYGELDDWVQKKYKIVPLNESDYREGFLGLKNQPPEDLIGMYFKSPRDALNFSFDSFGALPPNKFSQNFKGDIISSLMESERIETNEDYEPVFDESGSYVVTNDDSVYSFDELVREIILDKKASKKVIDALIIDTFSISKSESYKTYVASNNLSYFDIGRPHLFPILVIKRDDGSREVVVYFGLNEM